MLRYYKVLILNTSLENLILMSDITRASFDHYMMPNYAPVEVIPVQWQGVPPL